MHPIWRVLASGLFVVGIAMLLATPLWRAESNDDASTHTPPEPHWEYRILRVGSSLEDGDRGISLEAQQEWVGPIPHAGVGTVCRVRVFDSGGDVTYRGEPFYVAGPREKWERTSGLILNALPRDSVDAEVSCEPFAGLGFEVVGEPDLHIDKGPETTVFGTAQLRWNRPKLETSSFWCQVSLFDADGELIRNSVAGPNPAFWPRGDFKGSPPFLQDMHFMFRLRKDAPKPVRAEMSCSLERPI